MEEPPAGRGSSEGNAGAEHEGDEQRGHCRSHGPLTSDRPRVCGLLASPGLGDGTELSWQAGLLLVTCYSLLLSKSS